MRNSFGRVSLHGRVPTGPEFSRRWDALDKEEQQWVREAATAVRYEPDEALRPLVAGYAWRELSRYPTLWSAWVLIVTVLAITFALVDALPVLGALVPFAGFPAFQLFTMRRLSATVALNIGPPTRPGR